MSGLGRLWPKRKGTLGAYDIEGVAWLRNYTTKQVSCSWNAVG